jgi:hypothetical protein
MAAVDSLAFHYLVNMLAKLVFKSLEIGRRCNFFSCLFKEYFTARSETLRPMVCRGVPGI